MDLDKSTSTSASLKKLQEDGALPGRGTAKREVGGTEPQPVLGRMGLYSATVERRVSQLMISGLTTTSNVPVPFCEKGAAKRDAAINALPPTDIIGPLVDYQVAASLKEKVAREVSVSAATAATTSGGDVPKKRRKFSSIVGHRRKTPTPSASDASPPPLRRQRLVMLSEKAARAKAVQDRSGGTSSASPAAASTDVVVVPRSREATPSGPASDLVAGRGSPAAVLTWEELQVEMGRLLEAGARGVSREIAEAKAAATSSANERADRLARDLAEGLEHRMSELENNLSEFRGSLRVTYTGLHQLAGEYGIKSTIPANPDEFSLTSSLAELVTAMEEIPSKHAARIGEETSNGIYTRACHVLACVRLAHPKLDLWKILDQGATSDTRKDVMEEDLESALADQDRRIQYRRTKFEVAELERTMLEVRKDQAVETLWGCEVWFNSYLKSYCTSMSRVCRELRVPRGDPEESAAGYISWLNGAYAQLEGIGQRIDEALKQECRRSSRYDVLASIRDHRPQVFQSMDWRWPSW
ncbi:myosin heavy chain-like protein [Oryza sativa Japonica Group]|uniref:Myosin heavy chain-like protein n=1 Tax=Oryza sativa subsp. japonica TaxID=39947 RepID=Q5VMP4_ORYSJ|nr:myosin heavy chain-like protein [Oryza sativa Japonica Group]